MCVDWVVPGFVLKFYGYETKVNGAPKCAVG